MAEEEMQNKIRLNQVRRDAIRARMDRADGIRNNMSAEEKNKIREKKYGKEIEKVGATKRSGRFAKIVAPLVIAKKAKDMITAPTEIQAMDVAIYGLAFSLALFKDILDIAIIGALPAVGTVITFCISIAIGFVLIFDGVSVSQRRVARRMTRRFLILIAGTMAEGILFGLNFFPIETMTVAIIYWMSLVDRKAETRAIQQEEADN
jgi:hypothetical protein